MAQAVARLPGTFLVHVPYEDPPEALRLAVTLAQAGGGEVVGVCAQTFTPAFYLAANIFAAPALGQVFEGIPKLIAAASKRFDQETRDLPDRATWRTADTHPATAIVMESAAADWLLLTHRPKGASDAVHPDIGYVLLNSGAPAFLAPVGAAPLKGARVTIAWRDTRETRAAISLAMPLLLMAEEVFLVAVREGGEEGTPAGLDRACRRLQAHGCAVDPEVISREGESVARTLDEYAEARGCDVIVAGAYGHSRASELILGGVTRDLIAHASRWILFGR
jgi:nucleotide-binding universal stress UspA family protein